VFLAGACDRLPPWLGGERPPPFELFGRGDMRPGVSIDILKAAAEKESRFYRWRCHPLWARAQSCALTVQPGELRALVDSTGRVLRLTVVAPDSFFVWEDTPRNEPKYKYYVSRLRASWDSVRPHRFGPTDASVAEFRWVDPDGRWSGQMWYSPWTKYKTRDYSLLRAQYRDSLTRVPDSIAVTDEPEYSRFLALRPPPAPAAEPERAVADAHLAPHPEPPRPQPVQAGAPTPSELRSPRPGLIGALERLAKAQREYHSKYWKYGRTLGDLGWRAEDDVVLQLTGVSETGWAAIASHRAMPSRSCVYYEGSVPRVPLTFAQRRPGSERAVICDSF
jgi:hypothetical protein